MAADMKSKIYQRLQEDIETEKWEEKKEKKEEEPKEELESHALYDLKTHNICTGGHPAQELSHTEYLKKFAAGPCNPTVMIPGIAGSKLVATINCEVLKEKDPETFKSCGWASCEKGGPNTPEFEYTIWIPSFTSKMSIFSIHKENSNCFSNLLGFRVSKNNGKLEIKNAPGVSINPIGESSKTRTNSNCGFSAMEDLLGLPIQPKAYGYFKALRTQFESAGYRVGLTL